LLERSFTACMSLLKGPVAHLDSGEYVLKFSAAMWSVPSLYLRVDVVNNSESDLDHMKRVNIVGLGEMVQS